MKQKIERVNTSLEIDEDIDLHMKGWVLQRIGWCVMLLFLVMAGMGFFGDGAVSKERLADGEASLIYEGYTRRDSNTELEVVAPAADGIIRLSLSPEFSKTFRIEKINPEPAHQRILNGSTIMDFVSSGQGQITLFLNVRKDEFGSAQSTVVVNGTDYTLRYYIYP